MGMNQPDRSDVAPQDKVAGKVGAMSVACRSKAGPAGAARSRRALTVGLVTVVTLVAFEVLAVSTILPSVRNDLGGVRLYGWTFSAFLLMSLVGIVWAGRESDRVGPGRPFLAGALLFGIGLAVAGFAPAMWVLVFGRAIQGLGGGVVPAVAYVAIARSYSEEERPRMFALLATAWVAPGLIGPGVAAAVAEVASWRFVFLGLVPILAVSAALTAPVLFRLGPPPGGAGSSQSMRRALQLAVGGGLNRSAWYFNVLRWRSPHRVDPGMDCWLVDFGADPAPSWPRPPDDGRARFAGAGYRRRRGFDRFRRSNRCCSHFMVGRRIWNRTCLPELLAGGAFARANRR